MISPRNDSRFPYDTARSYRTTVAGSSSPLGLNPRTVHAGDDMGVGHHQAVAADEAAALAAPPGVVAAVW